jgi:hypothetical protein
MTVNFAKIGFYVGAGVGLILFVLALLLPVSYLGGVLGSKLEQYIFGNPHGGLVGLSMVVGVLVAGLLFSAGIAFTGWLGGMVVDTLRTPRAMQIGLIEKNMGQSKESLASRAEEQERNFRTSKLSSTEEV